ncbi:hypothetical protein FEF22_000605 [Texas Phoenix palm phytoplasma]|uniref:DUF3139 domain-containing protein n=1 Tax=Texas Phoenix palm phytoplasma TaxID=176709 RepID=A0ABS5BI76_9MOLU|nr:hypothetical protein [Texas Phoenix palm phytoplasma]MBP3059289.1 hypothetical protein [Texas Phoenix palm phytoplasma]
MIKIKKIIKQFFIILGLLVFLLIRFFVLTAMKIIKLLKEEIPILKETKFEKIDEWYDDNKKCTMIKAKYTFDDLNRVGYYQQQKLNIFHLHFNPVHKTLSIFKDKHNYDKIQEAENKKRQSNDW